MKTAERHQLKSNEVAEQIARFNAWVAGRRSLLTWAVAAVIGLAVLAGAFWAWRERAQEQAGAALAEAMSVTDAQVVPAGTGTMPPAGSYPTEQARNEAAVKKLLEVVQRYGSTRPGLTARYEAASLLVSLGRAQEAEPHFRQIMAEDSGIHGRTARMALAELQVRRGQYDEAIETYREIAARKDGDLPVDAVLMQLARVYQLAGKRAEALQTYQRVMSEFPDSIYQADARRAAESLKTEGRS